VSILHERSETESPPRKRWTREDVQFLVGVGRLAPGRFELIQGDILLKMPQGRLHIFIVMQLLQILLDVFGADRIQSQSSIVIDEENEPEPDAVVLTGSLRDFIEKEPGPADVALVVEVSDSTLTTDRGLKAGLYAAAGITEYWIVVARERKVEVYREPGPSGYASRITVSDSERLSPLAAPHASIEAARLFP
jgi:Uma2 family endonuclease